MPPKRKTRSDSFSDVSVDPVDEARRRLQELRNKNEENLKKVVADAQTATDELRTRIREHYNQKRQEMTNAQAKHVETLISNMERRKAIESEVAELVKGMVAQMMEVEEGMMIGYEGRLEDVKSILGRQ